MLDSRYWMLDKNMKLLESTKYEVRSAVGGTKYEFKGKYFGSTNYDL